MMADELRSPATDAEWRVYHDIRRRVLFELRGRGAAYDPTHADEFRPGHYPLVLWHGGEAIGVIRIDIDVDVAIFRRVAVREDAQRLGHGRRLLANAERFARTHGCTRVESHVDPSAVGFYARCGFHRAEDETRHAGTVFMTKGLVDTRPCAGHP